MPTLLTMAWRNVLRNRRRSLLTALAMGIAVTVCMWMMALMAGMYGQMEDALVTRNLGHVQIHQADYPGPRNVFDTIQHADALVAELDALPDVQAVSMRMFGSALLAGAEKTEGAQLTGVDPAREDGIRHLSDKVREGDWLSADTPNGIVLGIDLAKQLDVGVGDGVVAVTQAADGSLGNELYDVVGIVQTGTPTVDRAGAFLGLEALGTLLALPDQVHEVVVVGPDLHDTEPLVAEIAPVVADRPVVVRAWDEVDPTTAQLFGMQRFSSLIMLGFFYGISAVGVVNTLLMSVFERTHEFGVMRAIGMRPREVVGLVVLEALVLAVIAVALGGAVGGLLDLHLVTVGMDFSIGGKGYEVGDMTFDPIVKGRVTAESILQPVIGVFVFSALAAVWPALRAARLQPVDAMREA